MLPQMWTPTGGDVLGSMTGDDKDAPMTRAEMVEEVSSIAWRDRLQGCRLDYVQALQASS